MPANGTDAYPSEVAEDRKSQNRHWTQIKRLDSKPRQEEEENAGPFPIFQFVSRQPMSADPAEPPSSPESLGSTGLPINVAAALAVMIPLVGGIIFLFLERKERFVRFYSVQSIVLGVLLAAAWMILSMVEAIFGHLWLPGQFVIYAAQALYGVFALVWLVFYFITMAKAFADKTWALPYFGPMARKYLQSKLP